MRICEYLFRVRSVFHPWLQWLRPFRQAEELAEGQKSASAKHFLHLGTPLRQPRQLAERVEFPEKNVGFCHSRAPFGARGRTVQSCIHGSDLSHFSQWTAFLKAFGNNALAHQPYPPTLHP